MTRIGCSQRLIVIAAVLLTLISCTPATPQPTPSPTRTPTDYAALETAIEQAIATGPATLDNVRAVVIDVDGQTKMAHYRHGYTGKDHEHVWSVTKSVLSTLIGIAIADGLIADLDQPLSTLLPEHRKAMDPDVARVTLRQLMSMTAGYPSDDVSQAMWEKVIAEDRDFVDLLLERRLALEPGISFAYSNISAHLAAAVLAAALDAAGGRQPQSVLDYARTKLFVPLGIQTRPAWSRPLVDLYGKAFSTAGFGWGTDPNGIELGSYGLRLSAPDMAKLGELYRNNGVWHGKQLVPAEWIRQVTKPSPINPEYGLLWWTGRDSYRAMGSGGQLIAVLPNTATVVVIQAATPQGEEISGNDLRRLTEDVIAPAVT
jgi:CubicO group peptidase (beta-lactamase class C family)